MHTMQGKLSFVYVLMMMAANSEAGFLVGPGQDDFDREVGEISDDSDRRLDYEFFRPPGHESAGELPMIVFLHGFSDGQSIKQSRLHETMHDLVHATQKDNVNRGSTCSTQGQVDTCAAFDRDYAAYLLVPKIPIIEGWRSNLHLVRELIDDLNERYQLDSKRTYLTGFSDGGFATLDMIEKFPGLFAAGMPTSGGGIPNPETIEALKSVPLWFFHGRSDSSVNSSFSINMVDALVAAGGDAQLSLLRGGHDRGVLFAYRDRPNQHYPWLFGQSLSIPEPNTFYLSTGALLLLLSRTSVRAPRLSLHCEQCGR